MVDSLTPFVPHAFRGPEHYGRLLGEAAVFGCVGLDDLPDGIIPLARGDITAGTAPNQIPDFCWI